tara:strand:- start:34802 stop:35662 length:861 start_codon:yes stop_codon:yes gene_type:complete
MKYTVIVAFKDEIGYIEKMLKTLINQSLVPEEVILVNDCSSDGSEKAVKEIIKDYKNFRVINNISIDSYEPGKKIIKSFLLGYENLKKEYDFIVKLDADILLPLNYFKKISHAFKNENIGIVGGYLYQKNKKGKWFLEHPMDKNHVRGAIKSYSKDCYNSIGGLKPTMGWDSVDELLALYNGFEVKTLPNLKVKHLRIPNKRFSNNKKAILQGKAFYKMRYGFFISLLASLKILFQTFNFIFFFNVILGYIISMFKKEKHVVSIDEGFFIRRHRISNIRSKLIKKN